MAAGHVPGERLSPEIPRPVHTKRCKEIGFHVRVEVGGTHVKIGLEATTLSWIHVTGEICHHGLQVEITFAGVHPFLAGIEVNLQRLVPGTYVLKTGRMRKDVASGNQIQSWV